MYPRSFLCEEAKIKQRTSLMKKLREIGEEAISESRFTTFFFVKNTNSYFKFSQLYQYLIFQNLIRFIHYKQENTFFYSKNYCSCAASRGAPQVQRLFSRHRI